MKIVRGVFLGIIVLVAVAYFGAVAYMYFNQRALQYSPTGELTALDATRLTQAEEVIVPSGDEQVTAWYHPPAANMPVIVYYKGNAGSFTSEYERFEQWVADGYGFVAFDYRGFPASPGVISEVAILKDAIAVYDFAAAKGFPLVIWGWSLGTGPATYVASQREAEALLLETPFLSAVSVAHERYPILPTRWVMQDQFRSNEWIQEVEEPVLVAHGTGDRTIDVSNGERLYDLAPNPDELWIVPGAGHNQLWDSGIWAKADAFFQRSLAAN
ncbi:alpha/beta hydrolase [Devosia sp. RR2S18]|uniref:alpha/beta hydrolase n=1 Tax=Devosia rhizosphaerae TaxID=3049774 RepID=UPI0025412231|nr:alpha/beta hydrolase [Devosia sp. RR2S18]WIJ26023.1 alpha/beta hydrolase [Devosia sp. RR2S18]